jgi:hypothetical protein
VRPVPASEAVGSILHKAAVSLSVRQLASTDAHSAALMPAATLALAFGILGSAPEWPLKAPQYGDHPDCALG